MKFRVDASESPKLKPETVITPRYKRAGKYMYFQHEETVFCGKRQGNRINCEINGKLAVLTEVE